MRANSVPATTLRVGDDLATESEDYAGGDALDGREAPVRSSSGRVRRCSITPINSAWAGLILARAVWGSNQAQRSTSGKVSRRPEPRGHSVVIRLLRTAAGSASPSQAQAWTRLPAFCLTLPSGRNGPAGAKPVSSWNSRQAAASGSSPGLSTPLGMVQAPASRLAQNGPPGCARKTSSPPAVRRKSSRPALTSGRLGMDGPTQRNAPRGETLIVRPEGPRVKETEAQPG